MKKAADDLKAQKAEMMNMERAAKEEEKKRKLAEEEVAAIQKKLAAAQEAINNLKKEKKEVQGEARDARRNAGKRARRAKASGQREGASDQCDGNAVYGDSESSDSDVTRAPIGKVNRASVKEWGLMHLLQSEKKERKKLEKRVFKMSFLSQFGVNL
jgi:hypothetical protein